MIIPILKERRRKRHGTKYSHTTEINGNGKVNQTRD
jgi:hypothetical protein